MNTQWPTEADLNRIHIGTKARIRHHRTVVKRAKIVSIAGLGVIGLATTAAAVLIPANHDAVTHSVYCYSDSTTSSPYIQGVSGDKADNTAAKVIESCSLVWRDGTLTPGHRNGGEKNQTPGMYVVPALGACLKADDVPAVFPLTVNGSAVSNQDLCSHLSLRTMP